MKQLNLFNDTVDNHSFKPIGGNCWVRVGDNKLYSTEEMLEELKKDSYDDHTVNRKDGSDM